MTQPSLPPTLRQSFYFLYALYEVMRTKAMFEKPGTPFYSVPNTMVHDRKLLTHKARRVTTPNTDTLYSRSWVNLTHTALHLDLPAMPGRYYSAAFMDCFTNNFAYVASRTHGVGPTQTVLIGPEADRDRYVAAYPDKEIIQAPSNDVWLLIRTLVDDDADLPTVHALQDQMRVSADGQQSAPLIQSRNQDGDVRAFIDLSCEGLLRNASSHYPDDVRASLRASGIEVGVTRGWDDLSIDHQAQWEAHFTSLSKELKSPPEVRAMAQGQAASAWRTGAAHVGNFGTDYIYRAHVALVGLGALEKCEASYDSCQTDAEGQALDSEHVYTLQIPADMPVEAFWSLSLYEFDEFGRKFFTENEIGRFAIGDRTRGLVRNADGSITLTLSRARPADVSNWLPTPQVGRFALTMRYYVPKPALLQGQFQLPAPQRVH